MCLHCCTSPTHRDLAVCTLYVAVPDLLIVLDVAGAGGLMVHGCQRGEFVQTSFCDPSSHVIKLQCAFGKHCSSNSLF